MKKFSIIDCIQILNALDFDVKFLVRDNNKYICVFDGDLKIEKRIKTDKFGCTLDQYYIDTLNQIMNELEIYPYASTKTF